MSRQTSGPTTIAMASLMPIFPDASDESDEQNEDRSSAERRRGIPAPPGLVRAMRSVVGLKSSVPKDARTAETLGTERGGHGIVIDDQGLVVTVGYLVMEANSVEIVEPGGRTVPARVVAYDFSTGFGLVRAILPTRVKPVAFGDSKSVKHKDAVTICGFGGGAAQRAIVTDRRDFAGYWEYFIENAIFTSPPYESFGGAALFTDDGALLGVGSLFIGDAYRGPSGVLPGNMFIPIDRLPAVLDMVKEGKRPGVGRPWLGLYAQQVPGGLVIAHVSPDGPAARAGLRRGDAINSVGDVLVDEVSMFYRTVWSAGPAGTRITLSIEREGDEFDVTIRTVDRYDFLKIE